METITVIMDTTNSIKVLSYLSVGCISVYQTRGESVKFYGKMKGAN